MADQSRDMGMMQKDNSRQEGTSNYNEEVSNETILLLPEPNGTHGMRNNASSMAGYNPNQREETAAEIAAPVNLGRNQGEDSRDRQGNMDREAGGSMLGFTGLALSILSLFFLPVLLGIAGIVLGFMAMRRGSSKAGGWAIGIGAVSLIIGMFITPFF